MVELRNERGRIGIQQVPVLHVVQDWKKDQLIQRLRYCPYSDHFGMTVTELKAKLKNKQEMLDKVVRMIIKWGTDPQRKNDLSNINEASKESSVPSSQRSEDSFRCNRSARLLRPN